jgi:hypothetical protein
VKTPEETIALYCSMLRRQSDCGDGPHPSSAGTTSGWKDAMADMDSLIRHDDVVKVKGYAHT